MAIRFENLLLLTKLAVISTGFFSIALILKQSAPLISDFAVTELPVIYGSVISWLRPPYLYLVINCIIISIFATSKLQQNHNNQNLDDLSAPSPQILLQPPPAKDVGSVDIPADQYRFVTDQTTVQDGGVIVGEEDDAKLLKMDGGYDTAVLRPPERSDSGEALVENQKDISRPPFSARFDHKKSLKASADGGKALRVAKLKRQETLESTWRTITDGKAIPLTRHQKKSDTWNSRGRTVETTPVQRPRTKMKKSETFNNESTITADKDDSSQSDGGRLRREPSLSQDELNRRVEAFIKKFNEDMRLQRKKSLDQYRQMISLKGY